MNVIFRNTALLFLTLVFAGSVCAQDTGSIKGKVRTSDGDGISDVSITVRKDGNDLKSMQTDKKGNFRMSGLDPGIYNVVFEKTGYSGGVLYDVEVRRKKTNNLGDRLVLTIDQGTLVILEASVFNQNGYVIRGAKVNVEEVLADGTTKKIGNGYTSEDGDIIFRFPENPTTYRITASLRGRSESKDVEVGYAAIYRTAITIDLSEDP